MKANLRFNLTPAEADIVSNALAQVKRATGWVEGHALEGICIGYCAGSRLPWRASSSEGKRKHRTIRVYPDQLTAIHLALNKARERAGCLDDSSALVEVCEAFLDEQLYFGGTDFGPGLALSGRNHGDSHPETIQERDGYISTAEVWERNNSVSCLDDPQRRVGHSPAPAHRVKRTGWFNHPGEPARNRGAAEAISTRGLAEIAPPRDKGKLGVQLVGPFPQLQVNSVEAFAHHLKLPENWLCDLSREAGERYRQYNQRKRSGGQRPIDEPDVILKAVQKLMVKRVFDRFVEPSPIAYAVKGRSHVDAARCHVRQPWVGGDDIADFYSNVTSEVVRGLFLKMGCSPELAEMLVGLLTFRGCLPQGAPTSPAVANLLLAAVDHRVHRAAVENGGRASRYVDDLAYSGPTRAAIDGIREVAEKEIRALGFDFNPKKQQTVPRHIPQHVHGLSVNNGLCVPKRRPAEGGRLSRKELHSKARRFARYGCSDEDRGKLLGQIQFIAPLHQQVAKKLEAIVRAAPRGTKRQSRSHGSNAQAMRRPEMSENVR